MYPNRRCALAHGSDYFVTRDAMTETRDLRVSILHSDASPLCLSRVVAADGSYLTFVSNLWPTEVS
jgi:hypothetical protein